jgi:hypothetical protein
MPRGVTDADFGTKMYAAVYGKYREAASHLPNPVTDAAAVDTGFQTASMMMMSPRVMLDCLQPGKGVKLADCGIKIELGTLEGVGPQNAYRLVTDFSRRNTGSAMTFENAQGDAHVLYPFHIPPAENKPGNPVFQEIIGWASELTNGNEVQTARVLQTFSQAGARNAMYYSKALFPDCILSEHGKFSVTAKAQADGKVVVDIVSDPDLPVQCRQQYSIDVDGTCTCTDFDMRRV